MGKTVVSSYANECCLARIPWTTLKVLVKRLLFLVPGYASPDDNQSVPEDGLVLISLSSLFSSLSLSFFRVVRLAGQ